MVTSADPSAAPPPESAPRRLLLVGADPALAGAWRAPLRLTGHSVEQLSGPLGLDERMATGGLNLIILQPALLPWPRMLALCAAPRSGALLLVVSRLPKAMLWAQLLEAGADVVLPTPVPPALLAQVRAMLRRDPPHLARGSAAGDPGMGAGRGDGVPGGDAG